MSAENPREVFDENEAGIVQKNKELTDAVAAGDYGKVAELAQEAKGMEEAKNEMKEDAHGEALEMNSGIDEAKAAEEKASREAALAEQARQDTERSEQEAAALLEKMQGGNTEDAEGSQKETLGKGPIDPIELNNRIVNIASDRERNEALANLSQEEIEAVAKNISKHNIRDILISLDTFNNKPEIVSQPEIVEALKNKLSEGNVRLYDIDRIQELPGIPKEMFDDPAVQKGVENSITNFVSYQSPKDWPFVSDAIDRVVEGTHIGSQGLRNIAEKIEYSTQRDLFIKHFGTRRIYPELNQ